MKKGHGAIGALCVQAAAMSALAVLVALCGLVLTGRALEIVHTGGMWLLQPALAVAMSLLCAKKGVPAIVAWPVGSICFAVVYWLLVGMAPGMGAALFGALCGLIGGSWGEVWLKRQGR